MRIYLNHHQKKRLKKILSLLEWHRHFFPSFKSDPIYADHFDEKITTVEPSEGVSREVYSYNIQKRGI